MYLSVIIDHYNNEIVSYKISERNEFQLTLRHYKHFDKKREVNGALLHSDKGFQYTSKRYYQTLKRYNLKISMSRKGNCLDNAAYVESSSAILRQNIFTDIRLRKRNSRTGN
jgi:putative transposase